MNFYRDHRDSAGWHGDWPTCKRPICTVPVLCLRVPRRLLIKPRPGGLDFRIPFIGMQVKVGTKVTKSDTQEIEIDLAPPGQPSGAEISEAALDSALTDAIETIRAAVASAADGDDPFVLNHASITLSFAITAEGEISIGADGGLSEELTHTLTLGLTPSRRTRGQGPR